MSYKTETPSSALPTPPDIGTAVGVSSPSTGSAPSAEDIRLGMTWWNGLTRTERVTVLNEADRVRGWDGKDLTKASAPAHAWELWKTGKIRMDGARVPNVLDEPRGPKN